MTQDEAWNYLMSLPDWACHKYDDGKFVVMSKPGKDYFTSFKSVFSEAVAELKSKIEGTHGPKPLPIATQAGNVPSSD